MVGYNKFLLVIAAVVFVTYCYSYCDFIHGEDGGGGHWLVRMEWCPAGWSVCLPLLIFPCTIKSRSSLLAPAHPGGPGKKGRKTAGCGYCDFIRTFSSCHCLIIHTLSPYKYIGKYSLCGQLQVEQTEVDSVNLFALRLLLYMCE